MTASTTLPAAPSKVDTQATIRAFVAGGTALFHEGVRALLDTEADMRVVGHATTAEEAVALLRECAPDVVLVDAGLRAGGIDLCREMAERRLPGRAIVLSAEDEDATPNALFAGAFGCLPKDVSGDLLVRTVRLAAIGLRALDASDTRVSLDRRVSLDDRGTGSRKSARLSPAQQQVLELICAGRSNAEIARATGISINTVKKHIGRIYARLEVRRRADAVAEALRRHLV